MRSGCGGSDEVVLSREKKKEIFIAANKYL
jgi:hypothetical protein